MFNSFLYVYQRVYPIIIPLFAIVNPVLNHLKITIKSPFIVVKSSFSLGFPTVYHHFPMVNNSPPRFHLPMAPSNMGGATAASDTVDVQQRPCITVM